jgi:uncharacterized membrane protein (GlpM family)
LIAELVLKFCLGGAIVSLFALGAEFWVSKVTAGFFGAAPSVALATLAMAFATKGSDYARVEARSMLVAAPAFFVYCAACVASTRVHKLPVWLSAGAAWLSWFVVAFSSYALLRWTGQL